MDILLPATSAPFKIVDVLAATRVCCLGCVQERERRKDKWTPRWFRPAQDTAVHLLEYSLEECPMWEFTGDYLKLQRTPAAPEGGSRPISPKAAGAWIGCVRGSEDARIQDVMV
jgi:hypothetical protein